MERSYFITVALVFSSISPFRYFVISPFRHFAISCFKHALYGQQVFCCANICTMSLNIIIWTVFAAVRLLNNIHYLIIFHVKTVTRMARTLARMNRMARNVTRMAHIVTRMARTVTRMARWLAH